MQTLPCCLSLWKLPPKQLNVVFLVVSFALFGHATGVRAQTHDAFVPIVGEDKLLGGVRHGKWLPEAAAHRFVKGGEKYRFYGLSGLAQVQIGGKAEFHDSEGRNGYYISSFTPPLSEKDKSSGETTIGFAGSWNPQPRKPRLEDVHQQVYLDAVAAVLTAHGLPHAKPHIRSIVRIDLDGKGTDSVVIDAVSPDEYGTTDGYQPTTNSYSFILLRTVVHGKMKSTVIVGAFYKKPLVGDNKTKDSIRDVEHHRLVAILDLNGDGALEIVTHEIYFEGWGFTVYQVTDGKVTKALESGDGV
jgi:hypothetical protein